MAHIFLRKNRWSRYTITILQSDGTNYVYEANDVIRVKIGREGSTPLLDLSSKAASANGSTVAAANPCAVSIYPDDIALLDAGVYEMEAIVVDDTDDQPKHVNSFPVVVIDTQTGNTGL